MYFFYINNTAKGNTRLILNKLLLHILGQSNGHELITPEKVVQPLL